MNYIILFLGIINNLFIIFIYENKITSEHGKLIIFFIIEVFIIV
jgi:hypothetical protein